MQMSKNIRGGDSVSADPSCAVMEAVQALTVAATAMDDANQSLPSGLPPCSNGADAATVYFGAAEIVRETAGRLSELWDVM